MSAAPGPRPGPAGFPDPVFDAQAAFRAAMDALARPGTVRELPLGARPPAPLGPGLAALALALLDADCRAWLGPSFGEDARRFLSFETGVAIVDDPARAEFVLAAAHEAPEPSRLAPGTLENPHGSATLLVEVEGLEASPPPGAPPTPTAFWRLRGPGVDGEARLAVAGAPWGERFGPLWAANGALFPRGVDLILVAGGRLAALPRTARVEGAG